MISPSFDKREFFYGIPDLSTVYNNTMKKILFTGGGSAGHVIPNIALMEELLSTGEADVCYMGTDGIEKSIVGERKIPYYTLRCPKLVRGGGWKGLQNNVKIPFAFIKAMQQAEQGLKTFAPDVVFSKGGYVALPVVFAARKLKIPCFAHESDFSVGLSNRLTARKCEYLFTSFPETADTVPNGKYSGAPLRKSLLSYTKAEARKAMDIPLSAKVLLVFGGGSGSKAINDAVKKHLKTLTERYFVLHVVGKGNLVQNKIKNYRQTEFITDMGMAYACADVVLSRAGAGTIFELLALKKAALLVPLEGQTRGDQKQNAEYFHRKGLCNILPQSQLDSLPQFIEHTFADEQLHANLTEQNLACGNENILRVLRQYLKK